MGHRLLAFTTLLLVGAVGILPGNAFAQTASSTPTPTPTPHQPADCVAATVVSALPYVNTRDTTTATTDPNDPNHPNCGSGTAPVCQGGANAGTFCTDDSECPGSSCVQLNGPFFYNAVAVPAVKDPANNGNVILLGCDISNTLASGSEAELIQASIKTKVPNVKASFKGTSIFADDFPESGFCKYTYQRVGETDLVGATSCP